MKKYFYLLLIAVTAATAQNIQTVKINFVQTLYPKQPLAANVKNYATTITTPYLKDDSTFRTIAEDKYQADVKNYPETIKAAEREFNNTTLKEYNQAVKDAKEKYQLESDQYSKMSLVERLALIDKKPVLTLPQKPVFRTPPAPQLENVNTNDVIIFNPETLAKTYIKLEGFGQGNDGLQVTINFKGFEYVDPVAAVVDVENFNPQTKEKFYTKQTQYVTKYRHPATLDLKVGSQVLKSGVFENTAEYQVKTTSSKPTRIYMEREIVETILKDMNNYINDQYGYPRITRNVVLFYVKNKKGEYDDVEKAKDFAESGYKNYEKNQTEAVKDIENAIAIWEKVITEVNYDDSKARIDEKVGTAILKNLIFSTIITNNFGKASTYLGEFKKLRLSYDDKQFAESQQNMYSEMKSRFKG